MRARVQTRQSESEHAGALADELVVEELWTQFERHGVARQHCVETTERAPEDIAVEIFRRWWDGDFRVAQDLSAAPGLGP